MKRFAFAAATAITLVNGASQPAAAGPITTLEECYNRRDHMVPTRRSRNHDCSNASGLSECDEVFATHANPALNLQTRPNDPVARLRILSTSYEPSNRDEGRGTGPNDDGDRDGSSGRDGGRDSAGDSRPLRSATRQTRVNLQHNGPRPKGRGLSFYHNRSKSASTCQLGSDPLWPKTSLKDWLSDGCAATTTNQHSGEPALSCRCPQCLDAAFAS